MEKNMKTFRLTALLVLFLLLVGCAPANVATAPTATSAPQPVVTETAQLPTAEPTIAPTAELIQAVPTPISATSTPDAQQQEQASVLPLVAPCNFADLPISYSPDKNWVVAICQGDKPEDGLLMKFARLDGTKNWSISFNESFIQPYRQDDPNVSELLQRTFIPLHWTKKEDFVYLAVRSSNEEMPYQGYDALFRLDLASGKIRPTLSPAIAPIFATYDLKFSPDGLKLAYINSSVNPINIVIDDTVTGDEKTITLDARFTQGGGLVWSQDAKQLVVSVLDETSKNGGNSIIVYDLATMKNKYVIQQSATTYVPREWLDASTIYAQIYLGDWVNIDLDSGAVTEAPAPTPAP
jgi:hypothetical protein